MYGPKDGIYTISSFSCHFISDWDFTCKTKGPTEGASKLLKILLPKWSDEWKPHLDTSSSSSSSSSSTIDWMLLKTGIFLVVSHDSIRVRPSVGRLVGRSVGRSVRNAFFGGQRQDGERLLSCIQTWSNEIKSANLNQLFTQILRQELIARTWFFGYKIFF